MLWREGRRRVRLQTLRAYGREDFRGNLQDQPRRGAHHQAHGTGELYLQPRPGQAGHAALPQGRAQGADCRIQGEFIINSSFASEGID